MHHRREFPGLLDMYLAYTRPVQRADLARYCLLRRYGGVYADIDTRCLAALEPLAGDTRVILCEEPPEHAEPALARGLGRMLFNGTMASPAGHPLWDEVISLCRTMFLRRDGDVLEKTGPLVLTAAALRWPDQNGLAISSCHCFARLTAHGETSAAPPAGPYGQTVFPSISDRGAGTSDGGSEGIHACWARCVARCTVSGVARDCRSPRPAAGST